jgi:hypothetical protein
LRPMASKSARRRSIGSTGTSSSLVGGGQAESRLRPLARRRASTRRPPFEAIRAMKPCSRFRARFLG